MSKRLERCTICKKKTINQCKCKEFVCLNHRFPDQHNCSFNFKKEYKDKLIKELPKIIPLKITKI